MTTEELLKPRRKVIAPWPGMERDGIKVGDIIIDPDRPNECCRYPDGSAAFIFDWERFPHLFKPLEWWQERKPEDMPEYVRFYEPLPLRYSIKKITKWEIGKEMCIVTTNVDIVRKQLSIADQPATESDYQSFIQR